MRARPESPPNVASALAWELVAMIALHAESVPQACALVDTWVVTMKEQIIRCGVGVEHP